MRLDDIYKRLNLKGSSFLRNRSGWQKRSPFGGRVTTQLSENKWLSRFDSVFCIDKKPVLIFFDSEKFEDKERSNLHRAIWNLNIANVVIVASSTTVDVYNGHALATDKQTLKKLTNAWTDYNYINLISGKLWENVHDSRFQSSVDFYLLQNIEVARNVMINQHRVCANIANALIGKIIFICYLIDRRVVLQLDRKRGCLSRKAFTDIVRSRDAFWRFIEYLKSPVAFDCDVFHIEKTDYDKVDDSVFAMLGNLLEGDDLKTGQKLMFDVYDFSIIPIEFISNVYEYFVGGEERAKAGVFYTPQFVVSHMVDETVGKKICRREGCYKCRVLDPSCGSGVFLVEALRRIIEKNINSGIISERDPKSYKVALSNSATDNLFGIDSDPNAIQVAAFSICLTLLDYQSPADLAQFKLPRLIGRNLICADTFDARHEAIVALRNKTLQTPLDVIVGNPPWNRGDGVKNSSFRDFCSHLYRENGKQVICNKELAQGFLVRSLDFASANTICELIVTSKVLHNGQSRLFREYFFKKVALDSVFDMSAVRHEIFTGSIIRGAVAPACIIAYRKNDDGDDHSKENIFTHKALKPSRLFSSLRSFSLSKRDVQQVAQRMVVEYDWIWKVLVYGSYLDFNFIKRLKNATKYPTIQAKLLERDITVGQGIKEKDGDRVVDVGDLLGMYYLKTESVLNYYASTPSSKWSKKRVGYAPMCEGRVDKTRFEGPVLVVRGGTGSDLRAKSAIYYGSAVYKSSLTGMKSNRRDGVKTLRNIMGVLNSSFFAYYNLMTFSSSGIEREEAHDKEKWSVPYPVKDISRDVERAEFEISRMEKDADILEKDDVDKKKMCILNEIDQTIYNGFECTEVERNLIDYARRYSIPMAVKKDWCSDSVRVSSNCDSEDLRAYAEILFKKFENCILDDDEQIVAEIWSAPRIVGCRIKIVKASSCQSKITFIEVNNDANDYMKFLSLFSLERISEHFFIQKDIMGFEKDGFYVAKPNEARLWHPAIAYLDANDFYDAIMAADDFSGVDNGFARTSK